MAVHLAGPFGPNGQKCSRCQVQLLPAYHSGGGWPQGASVYLWDKDRGGQSMMVKSDPTCQPAVQVQLNENADRADEQQFKFHSEAGENDISADTVRQAREDLGRPGFKRSPLGTITD